jgi:hypothetical protein
MRAEWRLRVRRSWWLAALLAAALATVMASAVAEKKLLSGYKGSTVPPDDLYSTYEGLIDAIKRGDIDRIASFCLPHAVEITSQPRRSGLERHGDDINLSYAKSPFFQPGIVGVQKDTEDTYVIQTISTRAYFVRTKTGGWKVYRYADKPIE